MLQIRLLFIVYATEIILEIIKALLNAIKFYVVQNSQPDHQRQAADFVAKAANISTR